MPFFKRNDENSDASARQKRHRDALLQTEMAFLAKERGHHFNWRHHIHISADGFSAWIDCAYCGERLKVDVSVSPPSLNGSAYAIDCPRTEE